MGIEARGHTTSYRHAGTTLRRTLSDVTMAGNGLNSFSFDCFTEVSPTKPEDSTIVLFLEIFLVSIKRL